MLQFRRKLRKLARLAREPEFRRGLRHGVPAAIEHVHIVTRHPMGTLIDIGANRGQFSLLAQALNPEVVIHAFEPLSAPRAVFEPLFAGAPRVRLHPVAAGTGPGEAQINVTAKNDSSSLMPLAEVSTVFSGQGVEQVGQETVRIARVDAELAGETLPGPVFCKIDVQGFELEAIRGCEALLDRIDVFYVECSLIELYGGQPMAGEVIRHLEERGYDWRRVGHVSGGAREPGVALDLLFVRRGSDG